MHIFVIKASSRIYFVDVSPDRKCLRLGRPWSQKEAAGDSEGGLLQTASWIGGILPWVTKLANLQSSQTWEGEKVGLKNPVLSSSS